MNQLPPETLIKTRQVLSATSLSKSTVKRLVIAGRFPPPIKIGSRINVWRVSDVARWIADPAAYHIGVNKST